MHAISVAESISENPRTNVSKRSRELLIIVFIVVLGILGIGTCLIGDTSIEAAYTVQQMNLISLNQ